MLRTTAARDRGFADGGGRLRWWRMAEGSGRKRRSRRLPSAQPPSGEAAIRRSRQRAKRSTIRARMRTGWDQYFMGIAHQAATRATCLRKHVGAVIVRDRTVLSTGYNGSVRGLPHCEDVGCVMEDGHCVTTVHAEANAILQAAKNGVSVDGAELYTTASPCWNCFKLIANAGIRKIYYGEFYRDERSRETADKIGIELIDLQMPSLK
jgi:dCMP deaminase